MATANVDGYQRVQSRLADLIQDGEEKLAQVETALAAGETDDEASSCLPEAEKALSLFFRESFACLEGLLWRQARLDDGFCDLADKLLQSLDIVEANSIGAV